MTSVKEEQLRYTNGNGVAGKIKIDFLYSLFENFSKNFESIVNVINANHGSPFNERQSYGIFIKSIPDEPSSKDFVLTEVSLLRETKSSKGRVDFFVFYRNWLLLIELKLARTPLTTNENAEYKRLTDRWNEAIQQIEGIPVDKNSALKEFVTRLNAKGVIKIPMMVVIYIENKKNPEEFSKNSAKDDLKKKFIKLEEQIQSHQYSYFKSISNEQHHIKNDTHYQLIHGISFFAGIDSDVCFTSSIECVNK
ncbi:MAG: hypothetical protein K9L79_14520 [Methylobacter tundripaludum]|nr:hypothetical protein [Methylobacter tundripaludum]